MHISTTLKSGKLLVLFLLIQNISISQIGMNKWRVHFSTENTAGIANSSSTVYMATANGITTIDTEDNSISTLTITNGLSDLNITAIADNDDIVMIGYLNGNIDVIKNNTIINVPWIKNAQVSGSKVINNFLFSGNLVYISSNLGIIVYDIAKNEIKDSYYPQLNGGVNDVAIFNDSIFAVTNNGIFKAYINEPFLNDNSKWSKKTDLPLHLITDKISCIEVFENKMFFIYDSEAFQDDSLYYLESDNVLTNFFEGEATSLINLKSENNLFLVSLYASLKSFNTDLSINSIIYDYTFGIAPNVKDALFFKDNYWLADRNNGMIKAKSTWVNSRISSNSPNSDDCYKLDIQYGKVLVAGGGLTHNLLNNYSRNGAYLFEDNDWTNFNASTQNEIEDSLTWDVISVAINPNNTEQMAIGSYSKGGLKIIKGNNLITETYNYDNSTLEYQAGNGTNMIISDMKYDNDGNLWVLNEGTEPLKMLSKDGVWYSFNLGVAAKNVYPYRLIIDRKGNKWITFVGAGIAVFNENGTFTDTSDDDLAIISTAKGYGSLPSSTVKAIIEDIDGEIWIGTETGLVVIYSTDNIFNGEYGDVDSHEILLKYGEEVEILLGTTDITSITIDGGNRKWIGTSSSGVFCLSPNGTEEIYRFDTDNSPLLSNGILDIKINHLSGEVYFATESGLVSYRTDASIGDNKFENIKVFPNPVRPNFGGNITIQGLGYESDVKITDVSGNLIYKTVSNGGTVIWDGKRLTGERVQSGVYLVWSAVANGKGKNVAKILILN